MQTLYIMQGVPGSGKSTVADAICETLKRITISGCNICSTDKFHEEPGKGYVFKPEKSKEFHAKNQFECKFFLTRGISVIVDNTNIKRWEARPYVEMAVSLGIPVVFIRVTGNFKSIHGVPEEVIQRMKETIEDLTVESCLSVKYPWEDNNGNNS